MTKNPLNKREEEEDVWLKNGNPTQQCKILSKHMHFQTIQNHLKIFSELMYRLKKLFTQCYTHISFNKVIQKKNNTALHGLKRLLQSALSISGIVIVVVE